MPEILPQSVMQTVRLLWSWGSGTDEIALRVGAAESVVAFSLQVDRDLRRRLETIYERADGRRFKATRRAAAQ